MSGRRQILFAWAACLLAARSQAIGIVQSCNVSATAVNFGVYNPLSGTPDDVTGTVTTSCQVLLASLFVSWTVALSPGGSGNYGSRHMTQATSSLSYNLYTDASHTSVWGDGSAGTTLLSNNVSLIVGFNTVNNTVYGRLFAGQDKPAGSYSDVITVTITY